jgi:alpha-mannosidase
MNEKKKLHLIGNAHLDPVWLWRWQEGYAEIKATFRSALDRMKEFPEFIFTSACAAYYKWVEENAPEMFEEIRERVREGRWVIVGGQWIQPDCNIPAGESFVRHSLYSQRYFLDKFGVTAKVGYNVDSFGHNGMLPQILKKSGMDSYVFMRPGNHEKDLPGNLFWWESPDGSRVRAFKIPHSYSFYFGDANGEEPVEIQKLRAELKMSEEQGNDFMFFYGVGNHGGGPTIANLNLMRQLQKEFDKDVDIIHSSPDTYFEEISKENLEIPVVKDDLQHHASGCYSTHSETKANNRKAEHRLMTAEKFASIADSRLGLAYPQERLQKAWLNVLFNQFHDIMGGCSIKEAYEDARESYGEALSIGAEALNASLQKISWSIDTMKEEISSISKEMDWKSWEYRDCGAPLVVFNPLSWEVHAPVQVNRAVKGITDETGKALTVQTVRASQTNGSADKWDTLFMGSIPAMGYKVFWMYMNREFQTAEASNLLHAEGSVMENDFVRLEIDPHTGYIKGLFDKQNKVEVFKDKGAIPVVIDQHHCDTWAHNVFEFRNEVGRFGDAQIKWVERGPVRAKLRVTSRYNDSTLRQDFILYNDRADVEVRVKLDWREKHKMLKLSFPVNVSNPKAVYEIPYGFMERPVNGTEEPGQQWLDVHGVHSANEGMEYGLALLNDSKYSFDVKENDLRMTIVHSPIFADHFGERDEWVEYMDQGVQEFKYTVLPHAGCWKDAGIVRKAYELNVPPVQIIETYHEGTMPQKSEGIRISASNIIAVVLKKAEDGDGYILRCYETSGMETMAEIEIPMLGRKWKATFGKCEIKTFHVPEIGKGSVSEKNLIELS